MRPSAGLPGDRQTRPFVVEAPLDLQVIGAIWGRGARGALGDFVKRPSKRLRPLPGEVPRRPLVSRVVNGNIEPRVPHGIVGGGKSPTVPELGPDKHRSEVANSEQTLLEGPAAWLDPREAYEIRVKRCELVIQMVDHFKSGCDDFAPGH